MVKSLRQKFVIVTTLMMISLYVIFWVSNYISMEYWNEKDILAILEIVAGSGLFTGESTIDSKTIVEELTEDEPIIGIILDENGNVISGQAVGGTSFEESITSTIIGEMFSADESEYKVGQYIFTKRNLESGEVLIVTIDSRINDNSMAKTMSSAISVIIGIFLLVLLSIYLSKFVTAPAKEALDKEKRFVSDASHELKTPLGAISINAQALEIRGDSSIYVKNIISEVSRMNRLVERLLTLSKFEEGELVEKVRFSFSEIVQEMLLTYESMAFEKKRELDYHIEDNMFMVGSPDEIRQLIVILLDNAIKNTKENGKITVNCFKQNQMIVLEVKNTGEGISEEDLQHLFDRFYTSDKSRNNGSFGLGLAIAKAITERHKGEISVSSVPKEETVFTVKL